MRKGLYEGQEIVSISAVFSTQNHCLLGICLAGQGFGERNKNCLQISVGG